MKRILYRPALAFVLALLICAMLPMLACNGSDSNDVSAAEHLERGDTYSESQQWDEAIAEYDEAVRLDPGLMTAYLSRANAHSMKEQYDSALADLTKVIEESSDPALVQQAEQLVDELKPKALRQSLDEIASDVAAMRELEPKSDVEYGFVTSDELRQYLIEEFEEEYPEEEARVDQEVYVLLDLLEEGQDLYSILLDVLSEQVIGFYDDDAKKLYVVSDNEELEALEKVTFAHEYTHALQDQHFDLNSLPLDLENDSDVSLAALALVEGDATWILLNYMFQGLTVDEQRAVMEGSMEADMGVLEAAPRFIQEDLLFPYEQGLDFVSELEEWEGINQAYADLPQSTEQIIHPEKYLERDEPQDVSMPDLVAALGEGWSQLDTNVLGELYVRIYLETYVVEETAESAAEGWDGDRYVYLKNAEGEKVLAWRSTWDSGADAAEFFDAYVAFVEEKSGGGWDLCLEEETARLWRTEGLGLYLGANGSDVLLIIAPDAAVAQKVSAEFPEFLAVDSQCP